MGLEQEDRPVLASIYQPHLSPSHKVGLELAYRKVCPCEITSHHPTRWAWNAIKNRMRSWYLKEESPSHTVGLERLRPQLYGKFLVLSPSHAVGLEQKKLYTFVSLFLNFRMSPSHIVGLELPSDEELIVVEEKVSIPHSGLRTLQLVCALFVRFPFCLHPTRWA